MERSADKKNVWDRRGLPAWTYHSEALLRLEQTAVFETHWQIAGHVSDIPLSGDYLTFDIAAERALIIRDGTGAIRAFHNLCRHRGSRVVADKRGHCKNAIVCPFHGWVYNLDGTLRGPARPKSFGPMDRTAFGLKPIDVEVWQGLIFVRFKSGSQPPVSELMAPHARELEAYRMEELLPAGGFWETRSPVNWKSIRDVDNEGYHVPMAHPALQDLYGASYRDEAFVNGVSRSTAVYNPHAGRRWSVRNYIGIAPRQTWLPEHLRKTWSYFGLFPNAVIAVTPELVQFYQEFPLSVSSTLQRGAIYRRPGEGREQKLARYLATRIDRETTREDKQLTIWSNESMKSSAFEGFHLSDLETAVRSHHDHLRQVLPVVTMDTPPSEHAIAETNELLKVRARPPAVTATSSQFAQI